MEYCIAQTSLAHTYGNVTCFITEYIKNIFPKNYFKTIHISSSIAYKQFSVFKNKNTEFIKKQRPMLIIRPRVEINEQDVFMYDTLLTTREPLYHDVDPGNLQDFIFDGKRGVALKFLLNRLRLMFDVTVITETQADQLNQAQFLRNSIQWDKSIFLKTALESFIPFELMELISKASKIDMYDENDSVKEYLDYVNGVSKFPITYKLQNGTGNDEFFRFYPVNIDTLFTGLSIDDGRKKNSVDDVYTTTFSISTEFWAAGLYYLFCRDQSVIDKLRIDIQTSDRIIPLFTLSNLAEDNLAEGWSKYASFIYATDVHGGTDITDISHVLGSNMSIPNIVKYHKDNGIPLHTCIIPQVTRDSTLLIEGKDFDIDYDKMELYTYNSKMASTYRFVLHVNILYVNSLIDSIIGSK